MIDPTLVQAAIGLVSLAAGWAIRHYGGSPAKTPPEKASLLDLLEKLLAARAARKKEQEAKAALKELQDEV